MIEGRVQNRRPLVVSRVRGPAGIAEVEFVLDTAFTGALALPVQACAALGLPLVRIQPSRLANRSEVILDVYEATVEWDGIDRLVDVLGLDGAPLLGMSMLEGHETCLIGQNGGPVTIRTLC